MSRLELGSIVAIAVCVWQPALRNIREIVIVSGASFCPCP